jgi:microsomal epoxide hydrolase
VETEWFDTVTARIADIGAYGALQGTRPQSLSWLAAGNPVGQAAWITERFHDWSDLRTKSFDQVHPKSALLTNIMIYVMTGSLGSAGWLYRGMREEGGWVLPAGERCETPTALALFPGDPFYSAPPRSWAERAYNIVRWTDIPRGGHFAAMEEPDLFVQDLRAWTNELELVRQMT